MTRPLSFDADTPLGAAQFEHPWAARLFGVTVALSEQAVFTLRDFQAALTAAVAAQEESGVIETEEDYYACWLAALSSLLRDADMLAPDALSATEATVTARLLELQQHRHHHHHHDHNDGPADPRRIAPIVIA